MNQPLKVIFYVKYPYYFPHFLPISKELINQGHEVHYLLSEKQNTQLMIKISQENNLNYLIGDEKLFELKADYIIHAAIFKESKKLQAKSIFMDHGVGTKHCDYESALHFNDLVLVEGDYRYHSLQNKFPDHKTKIHKVGFSKLDMAVNDKEDLKQHYFTKYNLDKRKKTILYAPTFFPSSIEKMEDNFPDDFKKCNIIVKPHYLSLSRSKYRNQVKKFNKWEKYDNCVVCDVDEYNLVPFLSIADLMISDESSAIFEFTALNKPVILNRFLKLRWSYYLNPNKLLKRLDSDIELYRQIGENAQNYQEMVEQVNSNLKNPEKFEKSRIEYTKEIVGLVDGQVSIRIIELLKNHQKREKLDEL